MNGLLSKMFGIFAISALALTFSSIAQAAQAGTVTVTTNTPLPVAQLNVTYFNLLSATGGAPPYTWTILSGGLPPGLSLSTSGVLSGIPTTVTGSFTFTVQASSADNTPAGQKALTIDVAPVITTASLPDGVVMSPYSQTLATVGTMGTSLTWTVSAGSLPAGLSINASTGTISGTPTSAGRSSFTVIATDSASQSSTADLSITIQPVLTIPAATLPVAIVGSSYVFQLDANGPPSPSWAIVSGVLPPGISLSVPGSLSGSPVTPGSFTFSVQASTSSPTQTAQQSFILVVQPGVTITTSSQLPNAIQNAAYSQQLTATGTAPFSWTVTSGTLPAGLTLSSGGLLQGAPTTLGSQTFTLSVADARNATSAQQFTLTVDPPVAALSANLPANLNPTQVVSNVTLTLAAPHPTALTGQLIMTFSSTAEVPSDDPATEFSSGSRTVGFTIPANATTAVFPDAISLLTGTVAGTITLTANVDNGPSNAQVASSNVLPAPPQMTNITATRTAAGFDVQIVGYASARSVTSAAFTFDLQNGTKTSLSGNVDANFAAWYENPKSTQYGSAFSYVQSFNVRGDVTQILDVTVQLTNAQGSTVSAAVKLQ